MGNLRLEKTRVINLVNGELKTQTRFSDFKCRSVAHFRIASLHIGTDLGFLMEHDLCSTTSVFPLY